MKAEPGQSPRSDTGGHAGRPRLLFAVVFLSFFLGMQGLMSGLPGLVFLGFSREPEYLSRLVEATAFSPAMLAVLFVYQVILSLVVLASAYYLLTRTRDGARRVLASMFAVDVFLFLAVALYYRHLQFRPPSAEQFYYDVFCTFLEIVLVVSLSHSSIVRLTRARPTTHAAGRTGTDERGQGPC